MSGSGNAIRHLYNRAAFGLSPEEFDKRKDKSVNEALEELFQESKSYTELSIEKELHPPAYYRKDLMMVVSKEARKKLIKQSILDEGEMNVRWIDRMVSGTEQLREKMTLFWHGHFACRDQFALYALNLNNTLRKHALGNFGDLLIAVSKDPAMLRYLNNQQNKKEHPNENFAREVMELFTIGHGNYTEDDVKNAARAFTGWAADPEGNFVIHENQHDNGIKTFMGHTGNYNGEDILKIILSRKETAHFMAGKIYRFFVNQEKPDPEIIDALGKKFYESDYDITVLMKHLFSADYFYDANNTGNRIKSPVELIVSLKRDFKIQFDNPIVVVGIQKLLGQILFNPPNVSGWAGGRSWIDSSSLLYRMKLPEAMLFSSGLNVAIKDDPAEEKKMDAINKRVLKNMKCTTDISWYTNKYKDHQVNDIVDGLMNLLLGTKNSKTDSNTLAEFVKNTGNDPIVSALMRITSLPEYQLC